MKYAVALVALVGCTTVNIPEAQAPTVRFNAVAYAIDRTVYLAGSGCSAVAVGNDRLVTAKHCLPDDAKAGDSYEGGTVLHVSPSMDFAVVVWPDARLAVRMRPPVVGEHLYVVGYPVQLGSGDQDLTVTDGIVAGPQNSAGDHRITAPVYFGNSGGGVWSDDGELLGIAVNIYAAYIDGYDRAMPYPAQSFMVPTTDIEGWL